MQGLAQTGLPPALLELEIAEGAMMDNTITTRAALNPLRGQGVRIALDDFGSRPVLAGEVTPLLGKQWLIEPPRPPAQTVLQTLAQARSAQLPAPA